MRITLSPIDLPSNHNPTIVQTPFKKKHNPKRNTPETPDTPLGVMAVRTRQNFQRPCGVNACMVNTIYTPTRQNPALLEPDQAIESTRYHTRDAVA
jgi:hypothetical protein